MSDLKHTILVIDDERPHRKFLRMAFESQGYRVLEAASGEAGLSLAATELPDVVILDLGLPDLDGVEVARGLRAWSRSPIIVVSARSKEQDKVVALDAGADDYLTKPFGVKELLARVRVALRHVSIANQATGEPVFSVGTLRVDLSSHKVTVASRDVHLTPNEFRLLSILVKHAGKVLTHRQLLREVWGPDANAQTHYLRVYVNQLRQKLEDDPTQPAYLQTEPGVGYRLVADD